MNNCIIQYCNANWTEIGMLFVAIFGAFWGFLRFHINNEKKALERELENLRLYFSSIENNGMTFINMEIRYPRNMAYKYIISFFKIEKREMFFPLDSNLSVYDNFYRYVLSCEDYVKTSELTLRQMIELYNIYVDNLYQRHILNQTYQILYTCLHKIVEGNIQINKKRKLQSVQNSITSTQAILYFFNQLQFADRQRRKNHFMIALYENHFFKEMFNSQEYKNIQHLIPLSAEKLFYKQEK